MWALLGNIQASNKANAKPSQQANFQSTDWQAKSQQPGHWNDSILRVTLNAVRQGKSDQEIHAITDDLTTDGYTVEQTRKQVQKMIDGARQMIPINLMEAEKNRNFKSIGRRALCTTAHGGCKATRNNCFSA